MKKHLHSVIIAVLVIFAVLLSNVQSACAAMTYADTSGYESLAELYGDYFKMGVACEAISHWNQTNKEIGNPNKEELIKNVFNSITCGNEMKPAYSFSATSENLFNIDRAAVEMMQWVKDNGMQMRGHTLVWHSQVNPSIFAKDFKALKNGVPTTSDSDILDEDCLVDRETLLDRLKTYIYSMMEYTYANGYADVIYAWDVVNEASDESNADGLRRSYWYKIIGDDFLYYCFLYAREAETKFAVQYADLYGLNAETDDLSSIMPKLFYNDYNEWFAARYNQIIDFLTVRKYNEGHTKVQSDVINPNGDGSIKGDGLIDGIGMQGHLSDNQSISLYRQAIEKYSEVIDEVHITELDVGCTQTGKNKWYTQAKFYYDFFSMLIDTKKQGSKLTSVTIWGLTDDASWRADSKPLIFGGDLSAKPAYKAMVLAAKGEPFDMTPIEASGELTDLLIDFEPYYEDSEKHMVNPEEFGILSRGSGHQSSIVLKMNTNHTPDVGPVSYSMRCMRDAVDASCKLAISQYAGKNITFKAYIMTGDENITVGVEDGTDITPMVLKTAVKDDWTEVSFNYTVPDDKTGRFIYFESDGTDDMYLDDISVVMTKEGETAPVIDDKENRLVYPNGEEETTEPVPTVVEDGGENISAENDSTVIADSEEEKTIDSKSKTIIIICSSLIILLVVVGIIWIVVGEKKRAQELRKMEEDRKHVHDKRK